MTVFLHDLSEFNRDLEGLFELMYWIGFLITLTLEMMSKGIHAKSVVPEEVNAVRHLIKLGGTT